LLPDTTSDESVVGWGDDADDDSDHDARDDAQADRDDEERLKAERPPHHDRP
jgi:hypothetical protein